MAWLFISILAYFLNAISVTIDKFLLTKKIPNPAVYAFFISALSLAAVVLIPFGFKMSSWQSIIVALIAGVVFTYALLFMFKALNGNEASRITPFMGGVQPILVLILAWFFLGEILNVKAVIAFVIIIAGTIVISWQKGTASRKSYIFALISTALFALAYTINKYVYIDQGFITGFVWTRIGAFIGALFLLIPIKNRLDIMAEIQKPKQKTKQKQQQSRKVGVLFVAGQVCGSLAFILINYAISISNSVALINALQGLQYVFLLAIIATLSWKFSKILKEKFSPGILAQKVVSTILIIIGLVLLSI